MKSHSYTDTSFQYTPSNILVHDTQVFMLMTYLFLKIKEERDFQGLILKVKFTLQHIFFSYVNHIIMTEWKDTEKRGSPTSILEKNKKQQQEQQEQEQQQQQQQQKQQQ